MASMFMRKHPMLKTVIPGTFAIAIGDSLCQLIEGKEEWCVERTARMALTGLVIVTPCMHVLNSGINRIVPGNSTEAVVKKASLSAACVVFGIVGSFSGNCFLSGRSSQSLAIQLSNQFVPTYAGAFAFWVPANMYLLKYVPPSVGKFGGTILCQTMWSVYMSRALNAKIPETNTPGMTASAKILHVTEMKNGGGNNGNRNNMRDVLRD